MRTNRVAERRDRRDQEATEQAAQRERGVAAARFVGERLLGRARVVARAHAQGREVRERDRQVEGEDRGVGGEQGRERRAQRGERDSDRDAVHSRETTQRVSVAFVELAAARC